MMIVIEGAALDSSHVCALARGQRRLGGAASLQSGAAKDPQRRLAPVAMPVRHRVVQVLAPSHQHHDN
jgi:hypothetical protein